MIKPPVLKRGDWIGVVAPAGVVQPGELKIGLARLEDMGFNVRLGSSVKSVFHMMAGDDEKRARDFMEMFLDPQIKAVLCARGGYGSARVVPLLDQNLISTHPKAFLGSSDITLLHLFLIQNCGLTSFYGPMVGPHFGQSFQPLTGRHFLTVMTRCEPLDLLQDVSVKMLRSGEASGRLVGGCLSLLCSAMGTPYDLQTDQSVLFLEDRGEPPYRIDRMLVQLKQAGKFRKVRGILFGTMPGCHARPDAGYSLEEIIVDVLSDFEGPIVMDVPCGHGPESLVLPLGIPVTLRAYRASGSGRSISLRTLEPALSPDPDT